MATLNYLNQFPLIKYIPLSSSSFEISLLVVGLLEFVFLLLNILLNRKRIYSFFSGFKSQSANSSKTHFPENNDKIDVEQEKKVADHHESTVSGGDLEIVLRSLGMCYNSGEANFPARLDGDDLFEMFEEINPSLDDVKDAFDVFDSNRDGFIDEHELYKVLCALGLNEGLEMEKCGKMIGVFDENGDGRIDFDEFVKFMEGSFC